MVQGLEPLAHHGPTIAVKFFDEDLLLVGCGPLLKIYRYKTGEVVVSKRIFKKNKIHGISCDRDVFAFYGSRSLSILSLKQIMELDCLVEHEKMINDWIIAGEFSDNGLELLLLTAHNVILSVDTFSQTLQWEKSVYGEKSILYSGSIRVKSKHHVYVSAGTVMGGVVIWDLYREEIMHNLVGHEGSIFNVQVSDNNKYIVSCSDDRSIKLWDFETGELLSTAWGHTSRIWNLKFYNGNSSVISVSEDLTARTWKITPDRELLAQKTYELHQGRHIWGLDVNEDTMIAATGGNDGRVRLINVDPNNEESGIQKFTLSQITSKISSYEMKKNEIVKGFWRLRFGLVMITSEGGIFLLKHDQWHLLKVEPLFANFSFTNGFTSKSIVSFTNSKGDTILIKFDDNGFIVKELRIRTDVTKVINAVVAEYYNKLFLLIESPNSKESLFFYEINEDLDLIRTTTLKKGPTFVTTCFEVNQNLIFIGFRLSSIGIYNLKTGEELKLIKKLSLSDTVTSIRNVQNSDKKNILLVIANRDGYYVYMAFDTTTYEHKIIHSNNTRKGFLEGAFEVDQELIIYGFKSSYFYIHNESKEYEITYENCGGAHRQWKLFYEDGKFNFVYIRSGVLVIRSVPKRSFPYFLSEGTHGREIRDISIRQGASQANKVLYVTGAEDTCIKLSSVDLLSGEIKNHWNQRKHTAGLQKVKFLNDNIVVSSSAREEFFIWEIDESFGRPLITPIGSLLPSSDNVDLRIMDFDHLFVYDVEGNAVSVILTTVYSNSAVKTWLFDLETKTFSLLISGSYKSCCIFCTSMFILDSKAFILIGTTDGFLTLWNITSEIQHEIKGGKLQLTSTRTSSLSLNSWVSSVQVHQNGIKSFDVSLKDNKFSVMTGGDDNALGITKFEVNDEEVSGSTLSFMPSAASSTITSVNIVSGDRLLVASVDQIVRIWDFKDDKLRLLDEKYTTVADTGSSATTMSGGQDYGLIGGVGLSVWKL